MKITVVVVLLSDSDITLTVKTKSTHENLARVRGALTGVLSQLIGTLGDKDIEISFGIRFHHVIIEFIIISYVLHTFETLKYEPDELKLS